MTGRAGVGHSGDVDLATDMSAHDFDPGSGSLEPADEGEPALAPGPMPDFATIYEQHFDFVWRSARRLGVADRALDDAVQDVFIVVHRRLGEFEGRSSLKSWIFGIARRVAHDHRRRSSRKDRGEALPETIADGDTLSPLESVQKAQAVRLLHELLDSLDDDKREVFILAELEQMSVPEIAEAIGVNLNTVYSRLRAARQGFEQAIRRLQARERRGS